MKFSNCEFFLLHCNIEPKIGLNQPRNFFNLLLRWKNISYGISIHLENPIPLTKPLVIVH